MSNTDDALNLSFNDLSLAAPVIKALDKVGYETPSPIQAEVIPYVLDGRDVIGQAQTGTGKTAAFALPLLSKIDLKLTTPQILVLTLPVSWPFRLRRRFNVMPLFLKAFMSCRSTVDRSTGCSCAS